MVASKTWVPVLGVPIENGALRGMDALLSIVQMPGGVPVGTLAIGKAGAINAALLAAAILAPDHPAVRTALHARRARTTQDVPGPPRPTPAGNPTPAGEALMVVAILGGGQLARMLVLAGTPLGLRFRCLDPAADAVAGHVGELLVAPYDDPAALQRLAHGAEVVTFEFENVPAATTERLLQHAPVRPHPRALATGQDRLLEKQLFARLGMGVPEYRTAGTLAELRAAVAAVSAPCIVRRAGSATTAAARRASRPARTSTRRSCARTPS